MAFQKLFLITFAILFIIKPCHLVTVTQADEDRAVARIFQLINMMQGRNANTAAKLVRLAFHDCVGGCDGCINFALADNNGLQPIFNTINNIYDNEGYNTTGMSRADFYALAGIVAIRHAADQQSCNELGLPPNCTKPVPTMFIRYGRKDCPTSPRSTRFVEFPNAHGNLSHVFDIFQDQMNMTMRQVVVIIGGAHSLGDAAPNRSGFRGPWAPPTNRFDNAFFHRLRSPNNIWFQQVLNGSGTPRYQWIRYDNNGNMTPPNPPPSMMLNTDMVLFRAINPDNSGLERDMNCRLNVSSCMLSSTANYVMEFASNNTAFHEAFGPAYQILLQNGYDDNQLFAAEVQPTITPTNDTNTTLPTGSAERSQGVLITVIITAFMTMFAHLI